MPRTLSHRNEVDVVVIGAGAAGIGAAKEILRTGRSLLVVEARRRLGGRGWTAVHEGAPLDLGCGWLHSADKNPWVEIAETLGLAVDRTRPPWIASHSSRD